MSINTEVMVRRYLSTNGEQLSEEDRYRRGIVTAQAKIDKNEKLIRKFSMEATRVNSDLAAIVNCTQAELNDALAELHEKQIGAGEASAEVEDENESHDGEFSEEDDLDAEEEGAKRKTSDKVRKQCQRLYRKISMLCHPDRVKDADKNELFQEAHKAYKNLDVIVLEAIYNSVLTVGAKRIAFAALSILKERYEELAARLANYENEPLYTMAVMYYEEIDPYVKSGVMRLMRSQMENNLRRMKQQLSVVQWKLTGDGGDVPDFDMNDLIDDDSENPEDFYA